MSDSSLFHLLKAEGSGVSTYLDAQYLNTISSFSLVNSFYEMDGFLKWMDDNCDPLVAYCFVRAAGQSVSVLRWPQWAAIYTEHTPAPWQSYLSHITTWVSKLVITILTRPTSAPRTWSSWGRCYPRNSSNQANLPNWRSSWKPYITYRCYKANSVRRSPEWGGCKLEIFCI